jgi:hypothetical protein
MVDETINERKATCSYGDPFFLNGVVVMSISGGSA